VTGILNLPGLRELGRKELEDEYHVKAEPAAISRLCPRCGELHRVQRHGNRSMFVRDLTSHGKRVMIHLDTPRLICKVCRKTFMAVIQEVDENYQMTERLVRWIGRQALEYTYAELAKQIGIDEKTVRSIFDAYVDRLEKDFRRETPAWLGIDEIKLGRFRAIFTNLQDKTLVDMLPDRYYTSIVKFLESLPNKEKIEYVSTDMWRPYRLAVLKVLPQAKLVVDKFHVVSKANASLDAVRRSIGKADQKKQGTGLKKAHKLFAKRAADLSDEQYLTVSGWLNCFPLLASAYDLKERLYAVYEVETKEEAWAEYLNWEASVPLELAKPFKPVKTAFRNWKEYILNHFDDERITNAFTESFNAKVRRVYRNGHGYTFERLRAKVLFTDRLQKRIHVQETIKTKKQRFEDISIGRMTHFMMPGVCEEQANYEVKTKTRMANLGTDLPTLLAWLDSNDF
jgi:transposase